MGIMNVIYNDKHTQCVHCTFVVVWNDSKNENLYGFTFVVAWQIEFSTNEMEWNRRIK